MRLENISIVLIKPQIPENIGAVARAMHNMGLHHLVVVDPKNCDLSRILKMATGTSIDIIEDMAFHEEVMSAIGAYRYVVGTTARTGTRRPAITTPRLLAHDLNAISENNLVAILFGPEDRGLSNDHLRYCHSIATIPTAQVTPKWFGTSHLSFATSATKIYKRSRKTQNTSTVSSLISTAAPIATRPTLPRSNSF